MTTQILVTFAIFATFADFSRPVFALFLSKSRIWLNFIVKFGIFVTHSFHTGRKIFVTFAKFANFSKPFLTFALLSLEFC